jgi:hypothetical protein
MKKFAYTFFILLLFCKCLGLGIGEWSNNTPGGNIFRHDHWDNVTRIYLEPAGQNKVDSVTIWYFYKNCIIGVSHNSTQYFVVDEAKAQIKTFRDKGSWMKYVNISNLVPKVKTRWFTDDWSFNLNDLPIYLVILFFLSLILSSVILGLYYIYRKWRGKSIRFARDYLFILLVTNFCFWIITFIDILGSKYPESF